MRQSHSRISFPAFRFRELRANFAQAMRYSPPEWSWFAFGALLVLIINLVLLINPSIKNSFISYRPRLDIEPITFAQKINFGPDRLRTNADYIVYNQYLQINGYITPSWGNPPEMEINFIVDGYITDTQLINESQFSKQNAIIPFDINADLSRLGYHRVEVVLNVIKNQKRTELDRKILIIKREMLEPTTPIVLGISKSTRANEYVINGFADPNIQVVIQPKDGIPTILESDDIGHFVGPFIADAKKSTDVQVFSQNFNFYYQYQSIPPASPIADITLNDSDYRKINEQTAHTYYILTLGYKLSKYKFEVEADPKSQLLASLQSGDISKSEYLKSFSGNIKINNIDRLDRSDKEIIKEDGSEGRIKYYTEESSIYSNDFNYWGDSKFEIYFPEGFPLPGESGGFFIQFEGGKDGYSVLTKPDYVNDDNYAWYQIPPGQTISVIIHRGDSEVGLSSLAELDFHKVAGQWNEFRDWLRLIMQVFQSLPLLLLTWCLFYISGKVWYSRIPLIYARNILLFGIQILYISFLWEFFTYSIFQDLYAALTAQINSLWLNLIQGAPGIFPQELYIAFDVSKFIVLLAFLILLGILNAFLRFRKQHFLSFILAPITTAAAYLISLQFTAIILSFTQKYFLRYEDVNSLSILSATIVGGVTMYHLLGMFIKNTDVLSISFSSSKKQSLLKTLLLFAIVFGLSLFFVHEKGSIFSDPNNIEFAKLFTYRVQNMLVKMGGIVFALGFLSMLLIGISIGRKSPWSSGWEFANSFNAKILLPNSKEGWTLHESNFILLGQVVFAGYVVGINDSWVIFPVSAIIAWAVFRNLVLNTPYQMAKITYHENLVRTKRSSLLSQLAHDLAINKLQKKKDEALVNLASGKINPSEHTALINVLNKEIENLQMLDITPQGISVKDIVLAFGPFKKPILNGLFGMKMSFWLQIPLLYLFIQYYLFDKLTSGTTHLALILLVQLISFITRWAVLGFFFGFLYEFIRGNTGLRKALFVSGAYALSILPFRLLTATDSSIFSSYLFEVGQMAIFVICLGLLMDWETLKNNGYNISYMRVVVSDIPSLVSVSSVLITTFSVVITSLLSGQLTQLLSGVITTVLPNIINLPLPPGN